MATKKKVTKKEKYKGEHLDKGIITHEEATIEQISGAYNDQGIEVPLHLRGGYWKWNFDKKPMPWYDKITWVLTVVNVGILLTLIIKNI